MKKSFIALLIVTCMSMGILLPSCSAAKSLTGKLTKQPKDLESVIAVNPKIAEEMEAAKETSGMQMSVSGNEITYTYQLDNIEGISDEQIEDEAMLEVLDKSIKDSGSNMEKLCKSLEDQTGLSGITVKLVFTYNDEEVLTETFTAAE